MPSITIDGKQFDFEQGQTILDVASENNIVIPQYCYHPSLSIVASCRICLAEVWAPNPRNDDKLEPMPTQSTVPFAIKQGNARFKITHTNMAVGSDVVTSKKLRKARRTSVIM